ncbi:MAG: 3-oxoadipyl-CoA thiolase [Gammaproteobacteria bacterium]|nr:3-oxoadipyl-CoA thiolase [Gammaproteobacteria bacterium]
MLPSPVYICDAVRTPFGRYAGALATVRPDDLAAGVLRALLARQPTLDPGAIDDVYLGCANQSGEDNRNVARMALLLAGIPDSVPGATINRLCASGLDAVAIGARAIACGEAQVLLAGGVESMTRAPYVMGKSDQAFGRTARLEDTTLGWRFVNPAMKAKFGVDSMSETAENVAAEYRVTRADQDAFALRSQRRHAQALAAGFFDGELVSVTVPRGKGEPLQVSADEHPRADTSAEGLAKLKPVVRPDGTVTAGNASGINDGACALLLAGEAAVRTHGLKPRGRVLACTTAGVPPRVMGIGPVPATRKLFERTGLRADRIDVFEFNEAFAAQALAVVRELGIADDDARVNPNGGAIAIGHPLGASGARLATTALRQLERSGGRHGVASMCIGVGQGIAMLIERV